MADQRNALDENAGWWSRLARRLQGYFIGQRADGVPVAPTIEVVEAGPAI